MESSQPKASSQPKKTAAGMAKQVRKAAKAGSWYEADPRRLNAELTGYLETAQPAQGLASGILKALVGPHAGFTYSGPTAAWAYKNIVAANYDRVVLLGPSHSLGFQAIGLTACHEWATPFGNLTVDQEATQALMAAGAAQKTTKATK